MRIVEQQEKIGTTSNSFQTNIQHLWVPLDIVTFRYVILIHLCLKWNFLILIDQLKIVYEF